MLLVLAGPGAAAQPLIQSVHVPTNGWLHLRGRGESNLVLKLQGSGDLRNWNELAVLCGEPGFGPTSNAFEYHDPAAPLRARRFYRVLATSPAATNDWRNQITVVADPLTSTPDQSSGYPVRWVKFLILTSDPFRVYYQDSAKYPFHYDFAHERFVEFRGLAPEAFNAVSLHTNNQQAILGAVLLPPIAPETVPPWPSEYAIQFVGLDPYPPEQVRQWFELVRSTVLAPLEVTALYFPAFEQQASTAAHAEYYAANGIVVGSMDLWTSGNQAYSAGWALGRLRFVPAAQVHSAYLEGSLLPQDILLTDGVPVDMPLVAGILTLAAATPNSHVAILANTYAIPFAFLANTNDAARALALAGKEVLLQVSINYQSGRVQLIDMSQGLSPETRQQILALKVPLPVVLQPKTPYGTYSVSADGLVPADAKFFGGKAANFGFLRRAIPENSPPAVAFSLDLWDEFMDQPLFGGKTLRAEIADRLRPYTNYPPNLAALKTDLAIIRDLITQTARFSGAQMAAITNALLLFDINRNIRFRSSSNAEDNQVFTAAGLYDSFSGCLADDIDGDTLGPCRCDPVETKERGVFRAIQKVYASFYNDNAFLERLRHRIDETQVGMALLVHHSVPDEFEMANGVATLNVHRWWNGSRFVCQIKGDLVTQAGAVSVTNPRSDAQPERIYVEDYSYGPTLTIRGRSSLIPLGDYVLEWEQEYRELLTLLTRVVEAYAAHFPGKNDFLLDFEYKKNVPGDLQVKQVRELPLPRSEQVAPFLLGGSFTWQVRQDEGWPGILARQRLKCRLALQAPTIQLTDQVLARGFYTTANFEFLDGTRIESLSGAMTNWPGSSHTLTNQATSSVEISDSWTFGSGADKRSYRLSSVLPRQRPVSAPFLTEAEIYRSITVTYSQPVFDPPDLTIPIYTESISLVSYKPPSGTILQTNYSSLGGSFPPPGPGAKSVYVARYVYSDPGDDWPLGPPMIIKTFPIPFSDEILITGLISEPLLLTSYYAQSAIPAHHNWGAWHIFEPRLDPAVPTRQLDELAAQNIRLLHITLPPPWGGETVCEILGFDGKFRPW